MDFTFRELRTFATYPIRKDMETVTMDNKIVKTTMMKTDRAAGFFKKENVPKEEVKTLQARKEADDGRDW